MGSHDNISKHSKGHPTSTESEASSKFLDESQLSGRDLKGLAHKYWKYLDEDQNGIVSKSEVKSAIYDACRSPVDSKNGELLSLLTVLSIKPGTEHPGTDTWQINLSDKIGGTGLTLRDIDQFDTYLASKNLLQRNEELIKSVLELRFDVLDKDHNGFITRDELSSRLANPDVRSQTKAEANYLFANYKGFLEDQRGIDRTALQHKMDQNRFDVYAEKQLDDIMFLTKYRTACSSDFDDLKSYFVPMQRTSRLPLYHSDSWLPHRLR